jgi:hypothetical protein
MIIDYRKPGVNHKTHVATDAETGEDLSGLSYYFADDEAGILMVHPIDESGAKFTCDPETGRRPTGVVVPFVDVSGKTMYDYGDGYISPREPEVASVQVRRAIRIVPRETRPDSPKSSEEAHG